MKAGQGRKCGRHQDELGCVSDGLFQEDLNGLRLLKFEVFGCGIDLGLDIFDRTLFDHWESGVKLGWESGGIG